LKYLRFLDPIRDDLGRVENLLREPIPGQHGAIQFAVSHLVGGGGKRLRAALVLLSARLCGAAVDHALFAAAAVEMLHTATLIHDDLVDGSSTRRGVETLNVHWSPDAIVLTGDYLFARSAYLVTQTDSVPLIRRFAETLITVCNGEVRQMFDGHHGQTDLGEYEQRIYAKTASLIALAAEAGAILAAAEEETTAALRRYGERLGLAFQIVDDVLDFAADGESLGKAIGSDLQHGLATLPVLLFLEAQPDHPAVRQALQGGAPDGVVQEALQAVAASPAIAQALEVALGYATQAKEALQGFADSPYRMALSNLADFTVRRQF
jgi:geranylgeranyl pyrophosphate synthase